MHKYLSFLTMSALVGFILISISGCYYDNEEELYPMGPCSTDSITYSGFVEPLIIDKCYECHDNANRLGNVVLEGYNNVKFYADNGALFGVINHDPGFSPMPDGRAQLPDCDILKVEAWISAGALNN